MKRSTVLFLFCTGIAACQPGGPSLTGVGDKEQAAVDLGHAGLAAFEDLSTIQMIEDLGPLPPDLKDPDYPPGPYGDLVGDVVPNFTFLGYLRPMGTQGQVNKEVSFGPVTFEQLRTSGMKVLLIHLAAYWCSSCQFNARALVGRTPGIVPLGILPMEILTQGPQMYNSSVKADLDAWVSTFQIPFTISMDSDPPQPQMQVFFRAGYDASIIIDLRTMKIREFVFDPVRLGNTDAAATRAEAYL